MRGPVIMLLVLLTVFAAVTGVAAPARFPTMENVIPEEPFEARCPSGIELIVYQYDTLASQDDPYYKYLVVFLKGETAPFMMMENTDTASDDSVVILYYDFDLDGVVDLKRTNKDSDKLAACDAATKVRRKV